MLKGEKSMLRISISKKFLIFSTIFIFAVSVTLAVSENESIAETIILAEDVYPPFSTVLLPSH